MPVGMKHLMAKAVVIVVAVLGTVYGTWRCLSRRSKMGMTEKLKAHLNRCEKAIQSAKLILGKHGFPDDNRTVTVIGFISWLIEHQESILLLVMHDKAGSASALLRPVVEGAYRALWINLPATEMEVKKFNDKDKIDPEFGDIATALDNAYGMGDFFQDFKTRTWKHLNTTPTVGCIKLGDDLLGMRLRTTTVRKKYMR
jgi:hypothetical protein